MEPLQITDEDGDRLELDPSTFDDQIVLRAIDLGGSVTAIGAVRLDAAQVAELVDALTAWLDENVKPAEPEAPLADVIPLPRRFREGDRVRVTGNSSATVDHPIAAGAFAVVLEEADRDGDVWLELDDAPNEWTAVTRWYVHRDDLAHAPEESVESPDEPLAAWERELLGDVEPVTPHPEPDAIGAEVYVTGDSDEWGHEFAPGTLVTITGDDVLFDGSYYAEDASGLASFVGANDLDVVPPTLADLLADQPAREFKPGDVVRVTGNDGDGNPYGPHRFEPGTIFTVEGVQPDGPVTGTAWSDFFGRRVLQYVLASDLELVRRPCGCDR